MVDGALGIQEHQSNCRVHAERPHVDGNGQREHLQLVPCCFCTEADMLGLLLTCPKLTAACWAEAVNTTTVRYSISSSRVFSDFGNSVHRFESNLKLKSLQNTLLQELFCERPLHNALK